MVWFQALYEIAIWTETAQTKQTYKWITYNGGMGKGTKCVPVTPHIMRKVEANISKRECLTDHCIIVTSVLNIQKPSKFRPHAHYQEPMKEGAFNYATYPF